MSGFRELSGKHIVITGANSGIGKCMLNRLRDLGAVIVAADKDTLDIEESGSYFQYRWIFPTRKERTIFSIRQYPGWEV